METSYIWVLNSPNHSKMTATSEIFSLPKIKKMIPDYLVYEIIDGQKFYLKGYEAVLSGDKTVEHIMGASTIQSVVIS